MSDWSIAHVGDFHCPALNTAATVSGLFTWLQSHISDGTFNIKVFVSPGDLYEQTLSGGLFPPGFDPPGLPIVDLVTAMTALRDAGVLVCVCDGNHDNDRPPEIPPGADIFWNDVFPLSFFSAQSGYVGCMTPGDSSNLVMRYENSGIKCLFLTYNESPVSTLLTGPPNEDHAAWYDPQTEWVLEQAALYPDHNIVILGHYFISGRTRVPSYRAGPGTKWHGPALNPFENGMLELPNLLMLLSGHDRFMRKAHYPFPCNDGHLSVVSQFNTQQFASSSSGNGAYINLITFRPSLGIVEFRTYDYVLGQFLTNEDSSTVANNGRYEVHNFQLPIAVPRSKLVFPKQ